MKKYIALLRGVNISGKNKISMPQLKTRFEEIGFTDVVTHLNSGNIIFSGNSGKEAEISETIKNMIKDKFGLDIPVYVTDTHRIKDILANAPDWWGTENKEIYDNLIFVMPPSTPTEIFEKVGEPTEGLEKVFMYKDVIFWSFDRIRYSKSNWWKKTASAGIGEMITIRTANTVRKVAELSDK